VTTEIKPDYIPSFDNVDVAAIRTHSAMTAYRRLVVGRIAGCQPAAAGSLKNSIRQAGAHGLPRPNIGIAAASVAKKSALPERFLRLPSPVVQATLTVR
jgi:hypothetical protein